MSTNTRGLKICGTFNPPNRPISCKSSGIVDNCYMLSRCWKLSVQHWTVELSHNLFITRIMLYLQDPVTLRLAFICAFFNCGLMLTSGGSVSLSYCMSMTVPINTSSNLLYQSIGIWSHISMLILIISKPASMRPSVAYRMYSSEGYCL